MPPESALIYADEACLSNMASLFYKWSVIGKQPLIKQVQRKKERVTLFGGVEPVTGKIITHIANKGNTRTFFAFLCKLGKTYPGQKIYLVLDNVRFHHAPRLKPILQKYHDRIEFIFLPPYSPDLNPIERVWWWMRKQITHNRFLLSMQERIDAFNQLFKPLEIPNEIGQTLANIKENFN